MTYRSRPDKYHNRRRVSPTSAQQKSLRKHSYADERYKKRSAIQESSTRQKFSGGRNNISSLDKRRHKKRRAGSLRLVSYVLMVIICVFGGYVLSISPLFNVQSIEVQGNHYVTEEQVVELSGLQKGVSLFRQSFSQAEQLLSANPYILQSEVKRKLPATLIIRVTEREPVAIVASDNAFLTMTEDLMVVGRNKSSSNAEHLLLTGVEGIVPGTSVGTFLAGEQVEAGVEIIKQLSDDVYKGISEIDVGDPQKIRVFFDSGVEVRVGDTSDFVKKYELFTQILETQKKAGNLASIQYIDVSILEKPVIFYYN
ncbi:MAG: cell division protein FtsQ/DivIB [Bacillota bacterium]|jgi:cell division protein FtsQ